MTRAKAGIRCVAVWCNNLQGVAVCCIWYGIVLACCGLQWDVFRGMLIRARLGIKRVAVRCNDLQGVAVSYSVALCCSELQYVTVGCSGLQWFFFHGMKSTKSRNSNFIIQIRIEPTSEFESVSRVAEESECLHIDLQFIY